MPGPSCQCPEHPGAIGERSTTRLSNHVCDFGRARHPRSTGARTESVPVSHRIPERAGPSLEDGNQNDQGDIDVAEQTDEASPFALADVKATSAGTILATCVAQTGE